MQTQGLAAFSGRTAISGSTGVSASESRKESKSGPFRHHGSILTARGESPASHRGRRGAPMTRRNDREYREYLREEQRSQRGCIAGRMQLDFHHGLLGDARSLLHHSTLVDDESWFRREDTGDVGRAKGAAFGVERHEADTSFQNQRVPAGGNHVAEAHPADRVDRQPAV